MHVVSGDVDDDETGGTRLQVICKAKKGFRLRGRCARKVPTVGFGSFRSRAHPRSFRNLEPVSTFTFVDPSKRRCRRRMVYN